MSCVPPAYMCVSHRLRFRHRSSVHNVSLSADGDGTNGWTTVAERVKPTRCQTYALRHPASCSLQPLQPPTISLRRFYVVLTTLCHRSQIGVGPTKRVSGISLSLFATGAATTADRQTDIHIVNTIRKQESCAIAKMTGCNLQSNVSNAQINRGWVTLGPNLGVFPLQQTHHVGVAMSKRPRWNYFWRIPTYVITIYPRHRQTDRQTTCDRNTALCTKVHRAVKNDLQVPSVNGCWILIHTDWDIFAF